jgi:hypothetical protein
MINNENVNIINQQPTKATVAGKLGAKKGKTIEET